MRALTVVRPGPLTTVQDLGRPGLAHLGVTTSGAADRASLRLANRLVGNREGAAALEVTVGGLAVRAEADLLLAVTGATGPVTVDGTAVAEDALLPLRRGRTLELGPAGAGLRRYVAVRGGVDVPPVLGSRATDTLAGLGPDPLREGDTLPVGGEVECWPVTELAPVPPRPAGEVVLDAVPGPRPERLATGGLERLAATGWTVSPDSDRVGLRLDGPPLAHAAEREWPSEGAPLGAVQVPPGGRPVIFLADHPVTGGYPVVAVVVDRDVDRAAQLRPGQPVRLRLRGRPDLG
jgi:biotin-dependent carboxylase-like uncharacterized protein